MTTLICTGTLFSNWRETLNLQLPEDSFEVSVNDEVSNLGREICGQHCSEPDELVWRPFSPDSNYKNSIRQLLSETESQPLIAWGESNSSLYLDFWKAAVKDAGFVLFYSSPELELGNYISNQLFEPHRIEMVINAWIIRTQAMLTFFMNNRDRCLLIDVQAARTDNESFIRVLDQQFDLDLTAPTPSTATPPANNSVLIEYLSTTLLLKNQDASVLYDEVRSAASLICERDKSIPGIDDRNKSLISAFLDEVTNCQELNDKQSRFETDLYLNQLQISQMQEELEFYFNESIAQEKVADTVAKYLCSDPLLKIARKVRQMQ